MLKLLLLRHAKAIHSSQYDDFDRPLIEKGKEQATLLGGYIAGQRYKPEQALVSSARRTQETWEIVKEYTGHTRAEFLPDLYLASPERILAAIRKTAAQVSTLLVVGHNPGIAFLATSLAGSGEEAWRQEMRSKFPTCAFAVISFDFDDWMDIASGRGRLEHFVYPKLLGTEG